MFTQTVQLPQLHVYKNKQTVQLPQLPVYKNKQTVQLPQLHVYKNKQTVQLPQLHVYKNKQTNKVQLPQLHEVRETVPVSEEQCMSLVHVIFLYKENIPIFVGCCQAIAEILQKSDSFALTLFDRGVHLQVRTC